MGFSEQPSVARGFSRATVGAVVGAVAASAAAALALKAIGFTAAGPATGSYAADLMSSTAIANGGGVPAGSLYSAVQATSMGGGVLLGAVAGAGAVVGAGVAAVTA